MRIAIVRQGADWVQRHAILSILALALAARIPTLVTRPLWYDEAFAVLFSAAGPRSMAYGTLVSEQGIAADVHPLGYYTLLWIWQEILGPNPLVVRMLSLLLGLLVVYLGYSLSRALFGARVAALAGLALALSPFQVHYAQEVRMYALLAALLLLATIVYVRALKENAVWQWILFAVFAAGAQYTHTLAALYLIPLSLTPLWSRRWADLGRTALAGLGALLLYLPWLIYLPSQLSRVRWAYWIPEPGATELVRTWLVYVAGLPVPVTLLGIVLFGTVLVTALAVWGTIRAWRDSDSTFKDGLWLLYLAAAPPLLMFFLSYVQPVYLERALLAAGAIYLLWLTWAISAPRLRGLFAWTAYISLFGTFAVGLAGYYSHDGFPYAPFETIGSVVSQARSEGEIILHSNKITGLPSRYYTPLLDHRYLADAPGSGSDTLAPATQEVLDFVAEPTIEAAVQGVSGVWFVLFTREELEYIQAGFPDHPSLSWLHSHFDLQSVAQYGEVDLYHFIR